ncbi:MAG: hypothetical protein LBN38_02285, partial [Verrucomicrobiota bacterium]|nr:hypothetical protein [Verrucomicrobiota bacterium]
MRKWMVGCVAGCLSAVAVWSANVPEDLKRDAEAAMKRGADWLVDQQQHGGYWALPDTPALSALAMWGLQVTDPEAYALPINRALVFVLTHTQEDGS